MNKTPDTSKKNDSSTKGYKTSTKTGNSILEIPEGLLEIPLNPMAYLYSGRITIVGLVMTVVFGVVGSLFIYNAEENPATWLIFVGSFIWVLAALAFTVCFFGFLEWRSCHKKHLIDKSAQRLTFADGMQISFNDISAIYLEAYTYEDAESNTREHYQILLITQDIDPEVRNILTQLTEVIDRSFEAEDRKSSQRLIRELSEKLNAFELQALGVRHEVVKHSNGLKMWNVAEALSRIFDVPILEAYGTRIVVRTPVMLDLPLSKQLRGQEELAVLGAAPTGITANIEGSCFQVSWMPHPRLGATLFGFIIITPLFGGYVLAITTVIENSWIMIAVSIGVIILLGLYFWREYRISKIPARLHIKDGVVTYTNVTGDTTQLSVDHLEAVRVYIRFLSAVALIGENKIIRCKTKGKAQARWLAQAVRCFVAGEICD